MKKKISKVLLVAVSIMNLLTPIRVEASQLYYYNRYTVQSVTTYTEQFGNTKYISASTFEKNYGTFESGKGYYQYNLNPSTGTFSLSGVQKYPPAYFRDGSSIIWARYGTVVNGILQNYQTYTITAKATSSNVRGSFLNTLIAANGTYPTNGISGGYWYVRGGIANSPPTVPSSITVPANIKSGTQFTVSRGSSTDSEGDSISYYLERSVNGGTFTQVSSNMGATYKDTPLATWNTVSYRVRAYDGEEFSGYRTSPTRTVTHNSSPTINVTSPN